jgi:hypothetical protein
MERADLRSAFAKAEDQAGNYPSTHHDTSSDISRDPLVYVWDDWSCDGNRA